MYTLPMTTDDLVFPTVHLNGTSAEHLLEQVTTASQKIREALLAIEDGSPNARDYYPQGDDAFRKAAGQYQARRGKLTSVLRELEAIEENIVSQEEARRANRPC